MHSLSKRGDLLVAASASQSVDVDIIPCRFLRTIFEMVFANLLSAQQWDEYGGYNKKLGCLYRNARGWQCT